jgi:hypothetical protein
MLGFVGSDRSRNVLRERNIFMQVRNVVARCGCRQSRDTVIQTLCPVCESEFENNPQGSEM